ncbi:MAG: CHAT domain-containing protein [Ardenticatenia bacterium]|nr:CHAT domain-containing protein [Ardenticatenia bacterium]
MCSPEALLAQWEQVAPTQFRAWFTAHLDHLTDAFFERMKARIAAHMQQDAKRALELAQSLLLAAELTQRPMHTLLGLMALANVYGFAQGRYQEALETFEEALALAKACGAHAQAHRIRMAQIYVLGMLSRFDEALAIGEALCREVREAGNWLVYMGTLNNMAIVCRRRGDLSRALALQDEHERFLSQCPLTPSEYYNRLFRLHLNRSIIFIHLNAFQEAIQVVQEALHIAENIIKQPARVARAKDSLGLIYFYKGAYNDALAYFQEARRTFEACHLQRDAVIARLFETQCLLALNDVETVEQTASHIIDYCVQTGMDHELALAYLYRSKARRHMDRLLLAANDLEQAAMIFKAHNNKAWLGQVYLELAYVFLATDSLFEATLAAETAQHYFERLDLPLERAQALLVQGLVAEQRDWPAIARRLYRDVLHIGRREQLPMLIYPACYGLARLERRVGHVEAARARFRQAIQAIEELRGSVAVELRVPFLADKLDLYEQAIALELDTDAPEDAFRLVQYVKSRALLDLLGEEHSLRFQAVGADERQIVEEIHHLRERWRWLQRRALYISMQTKADSEFALDRRQRKALLEEAQECESRLRALFREFQVRRTAARRLTPSLAEVSVNDVRAHLPPDTLLVEYFAIAGRLWAFVVTDKRLRVRELCDITHIHHLMGRWRLLMGHMASSGRARLEAVQRVLGHVYELIFAPLEIHELDRSHIYVVPHGVLHYLPFAALYNRRDGRYLVEEAAVARLPSSGLLGVLRARAKRAAEGTPLILGHSHHGMLPVAVEEARDVTNTVGGECYLEEEALGERLTRGEVWRPLIHVAAHGLFRTDAPLFSSIYLADGPLTTLDLFNASMPSGLLVLSACETGLGVVHPGDEIMGLSRACLHAGAQSLLLSLWRIEDRTTRTFMLDLYAHLLAGASPAEALAAVQRRCLHDPATAHPFYWAAFSVTGDAFTPVRLAATRLGRSVAPRSCHRAP